MARTKIEPTQVILDTDGALTANSDNVIPSQKAIKTYADTKVAGPASAVDLDFAQFDGVTGKLVKDGGLARDTDGTLAANSDSKIPSQKAVKTYADALIAAADAMIFKGVIDCSANPNYPAADRGWTYRVSVAGKIGGVAGPNVEAGDLLLCLDDGTPSGNQATVGLHWSIAQVNLDGAVIGPASAVDATPAIFDGASGKLIKNVSYAVFKSSLALTSTDVGLGNVTNDAQLKAVDKDTDGTLAANSDIKIPSQKAVKTYVDAHSGSGSPINPITVSGTQDGSNKIFTLASAISSGTEFVFVNGQLLVNGASDDYLVSGTTLTFQAACPAPISTDKIKVYAMGSAAGYNLTANEYAELQLGLISGGGRYEQDIIVTNPRTVIDYVRVEGNLRLENELRIQPSDLGAAISPTAPPIVTPGSDRIFDQLLTSPQSTFDITNIVQNFLHLRLVFYLRGTSAADGADWTIRFNNDSGSNYDSERGNAFSSTTQAGGADAATSLELFVCPQANSAAGSFVGGELLIPNYAGTVGHKSVVGTAFSFSTATRNVYFSGGRWRSASPINRITLIPPAGNWDIGSRATLYILR